MNVLSVCSGIGAAELAWARLGWHVGASAEIDPFANAVREHRFPNVPNWGDITRFQEWPDAAVDVLVGGTPCQSFSVAGLRGGLADPRGNLALAFVEIALRYRPRWVVWENVPGVLSSDEGRDFGSILGGLGECGYGWAYRVLDAQYFGVAQRRRRVFVVGHLGDWRPAAAVLFERESLYGHPAPRREAGEGTALDLAPSFAGSDRGVERTGESRGQDPVIVTFDARQSDVIQYGNMTGPLDTDGHTMAVASLKAGGGKPGQSYPAIASFQQNSMSGRGTLGYDADTDILRPIKPQADHQMLQLGSAVRRLTPVECERLQGFPDGFTAIPYRGKPASDGPRYKALGNSMAVPCMAWLGRRIQLIGDLMRK